VHEDRGVSGAAQLDRRPGLLAALDCLARHKATYLVAAKRDRFARDIVVAVQRASSPVTEPNSYRRTVLAKETRLRPN